MTINAIKKAIENDPANSKFLRRKWHPIFIAHPRAKILIVGQAPGMRAQTSGIPWNDPSGDNLRTWMKISKDDFYSPEKIALLPMDFYFPGSGETGDVPPRKGFAEKWHPLILKCMPDIKLTLLVGQYAQEYYLGDKRMRTLTDTVRAFETYTTDNYFPLVHPSPRNNIWKKKNPWFELRVIPILRKRVHRALT